LLRAAGKVGEHPAAATLAYHRATLLSVQGQRDEAAAIVDALLPGLKGLPSARNRALGLRAMLASDAQELLLYGVRPPVLLTYDLGRSGHLHAWQLAGLDAQRQAALQAAEGLHWGPETAEILNDAVALDALAAMIAPGGSPTRPHTELLLAAWTRAVLLDRWDLVRSLAAGIVQAAPSTRADIEELLSASTPDRMRYFAARALLKLPGASVTLRSGPLRLAPVDQIDRYGRNWWAAPSNRAEILEFLAEDQRRTIAAEWERIRAAGDGRLWLLRQALAEAERPEPHSTAAETLYLALACSKRADGSLGHDPGAIQDVQKQAIAALERRFSASNWSDKLARTIR
jgi:hypothetical protein